MLLQKFHDQSYLPSLVFCIAFYSFTIACRQLRTRDCHDCTFHLYVKTEPIIETSHNVRFAPFNAAYRGHSKHLAAAGLTSPNLWYAVYDFNDEAKTGEHCFGLTT